MSYYTAPLSANTLAANSKQATQLSQRAALPALCCILQPMWKGRPHVSSKTVPGLGDLKETFHGIPAKVYPVSADSV